MPNLNNIVKMTQAQYDTMMEDGEVTIGNETVVYDPNNIYLVDGDDLRYITTAPSSANTSGLIKIVVLDSEPSTKYDGYIYLIKSNS